MPKTKTEWVMFMITCIVIIIGIILTIRHTHPKSDYHTPKDNHIGSVRKDYIESTGGAIDVDPIKLIPYMEPVDDSEIDFWTVLPNRVKKANF